MKHSKKAITATRGIRLFAAAALLALLTGLLAITQPVRANTYNVTSSANIGPGTLREAIDFANSHDGPDTITFSASTIGNPIILSGSSGEDGNASGDLDILGGGDLIIQGIGVGSTIVDGGGIDRVFHVCPPGNCTNTVTLSGMTIRNGAVDHDAGDHGAGIYIEAGTTIVDGCTISDNNATVYGGGIYNKGTLNVQNGSLIGGTGTGNTVTVSGAGGGIYNYSGTTTVTGSTVSANTANNGGGIYSYRGTTIVDSSTVSANNASYGAGIANEAMLTVRNSSTIGGAGAANMATKRGGGIYNGTSGTTTVDGSTVSANTAGENGGGIYNTTTLIIQNGSTIGATGMANTAADDGGGIYNYSGTTTVTGSTVSANTATVNGGGIFNSAGTTTVDGSTVSANKAALGGGIYNEAALNVQNVSTIGGTGSGNTASGDGGGIYHFSDTTTVTNSTVSDNVADGNGGGIFINIGTTTVTGSTVSDNEAHNGGGIYNKYTLNVQGGSTIGGDSAANKASNDGGGIYNKAGTTTVTGSVVSANTAADEGGGIKNFAGTTTVDASTVSANEAVNGGGIINEDTLIVQNSSIIGGASAANKASSGGGGIFNYSGTTMVTGSTVISNTATLKGGGILNFAGTTTVDSSTVSDNEAYDGGGIWNIATLIVENGSIIGGAGAGNAADNGGGIFSDTGGTTTVSASDVSSNTANSQGGGIVSYEGTMTVFGSTVSANEADEGGGLYIEGGTTTVDGSTVSANEADDGGGILIWDGTLIVENGSTIGGVGTGNTAANYGGGINNSHGSTTVTDSRILNNMAAEGGGVYNDEDITGATGVTDSCIVGNSDNAFFNNQTEQQIATSNWWGAAGGPTAPGADKVGGNVNVSGHKTTPILNCGSDLQVNKGNDTGGSGIVGTPFNWTLTISNTGLFSATFAAGQTILLDDLPPGPTYGDPAVGSFVDVTNSNNIQCSPADNTITCAATGGDVTIEPSTGSFEVTISVTPNAPATLFNPVKPDGVCSVDPDGNVPENDKGNNDCLENVVTVSAPDLQVGKSNDTGGNVKVGESFHWILTISNTGVSGATFAAGQTILVDDLPSGPTYGNPAAGSFVDITNQDQILCSRAGNTITCTAGSADVTLAANTGGFEVTISVTSDAPATLTNPKAGGTCKVDPSGNIPENDDSNNDCPENTVDVSISFSYLYLPVVMK